MPEPTPAPDLTVLSHIELLNAYMVALGTAIRRPVSMIERSDAIRAELLRRLTRAAEPDSGRVANSCVFRWKRCTAGGCRPMRLQKATEADIDW